MDILLRFDSAQRQGENKTAQLWAAGEQRPRASGPCPPLPESRSPAWPGPCARGPRGSFSPSAGGRGEEPRGSRPASCHKGRSASPPRRSQPQRRGVQPRGLDTARPAAPEEAAAAQEDVAEMKRKTGRRDLQAPTMEGAAEEAPTPGCFPFSRSLSARPRPAGCHRCSPAPQEPHRPKMAAPRLPPLPPAAGSDAAAAWSSANQYVRSKRPAAVARGDSSCWF